MYYSKSPGRIAPRAMHRAKAVAALLLALSWSWTAGAIPLISEVLYDAVGSDDGQSFVELYGPPGTVLDGITLEGVNGSNGAIGPIIVLSGVIPADGLFVVADRMSDGTSLVVEADQLANFDFQNGPDSIVLVEDGFVLDAIGYGVFDPGDVFAGEGASAADPSAGSSLARLFADIDTDDNGLDFVVRGSPTPGSADFFNVPEPGSGLLTLSGLAMLGWQRRAGRGVGATRGSRAS
jgi:hypothetical protein